MAIEQIAIYAVIVLVGLSAISIILFGARSLINGKIEPMKMAFLSFPFVLFAILGFTGQTWAEAGIWTLVVMIAIAVLAMLYTSFRGVFR